ncbi:hypothetical protein [Neisseria musculi]|uniref:hypothetical protein n=1 Tax=Neisseria musculi TaxID=1815583 RepID=UPI00164BBD2C|nr:hypothetical protein [Neisseria musculi]
MQRQPRGLTRLAKAVCRRRFCLLRKILQADSTWADRVSDGLPVANPTETGLFLLHYTPLFKQSL